MGYFETHCSISQVSEERARALEWYAETHPGDITVEVSATQPGETFSCPDTLGDGTFAMEVLDSGRKVVRLMLEARGLTMEALDREIDALLSTNPDGR